MPQSARPPCRAAAPRTPPDSSRQVFPKGTDQSTISQTELNDLARLMNQRRRNPLGWKTPLEAMAEDLAAFRSTGALET